MRRVTGGMYVPQGHLKAGIMAPSLLLNPPFGGDFTPLSVRFSFVRECSPSLPPHRLYLDLSS